MRWLSIVLLAGCIPNFELDSRAFQTNDAAFEDALPQNDADPVDADPVDADPLDAEAPDASRDAEVIDTGTSTEAPDSGEHPDATTGEICNNGVDDDGDTARDCADEECGLGVCPEDQNDCTVASCSGDGVCGFAPSNLQGATWECRGFEKHEVTCDNGFDDDDDTMSDCHDEEDCSCSLLGTNLTCCADGSCRVLCL